MRKSASTSSFLAFIEISDIIAVAENGAVRGGGGGELLAVGLGIKLAIEHFMTKEWQ